jgi:Tfp pilus assembly protein PilX
MREDHMTSCGRRLVRDERGWALVTSFILMSVMLGLGLAVFATSDTQTKQTGRERERESRLNLTEGVLSSQIFALSRNWPATDSTKYPPYCTETSVNAAQCPQAARVREHFQGADFKAKSTWTVLVRDNSGSSRTFYSDATTLNLPSWDADGDGQVWVRAEGRLDDRVRILVARVKVELLPVNFPNAPFVAGSISVSNSGIHGDRSTIDTKGAAGVVRCTTTQPINASNPCVGYEPNKNQVNGPILQDPDAPQNIVSPEVLDALRQTARANGTYNTGCPLNATGKVVFVESGDCAYNNQNTKTDVNSKQNPGLMVINSGTWECEGNINWYGVVYVVNAQGSNGVVLDNTGGCTIQGGIFADGVGKVAIGANAPNLIYDPTMVLNATAYGTAGIVQNTWREYTP